MKKLLFTLSLIYFAILAAVPGCLIFRHYHILAAETIYKFEVKPYDPYDPFRGRYVAIQSADTRAEGNGPYALLETGDDGFAFVSRYQNVKPALSPYVKNLKLDRYYLNEKQAPRVEAIQRKLDPETDRMYVEIAVKNGSYEIRGMYLNGIPVEDLE
jgi:uncharacterized membrane-anchored protein